MDLLAKTTSPQDRFMQLLSLQQMTNPGGSGAPGSVDPASSGSGTAIPSGPTKYGYTEYDRPYSGVPANMLTRFGVTLQPGPMRSLLEIARASGLLPGAQEVGQIGQGYRSYSDQVAGYASDPGRFAPPGQSYHGQGLAIDAAWWTEHAKLARELGLAGWNQLPSESWHYSYGASG
jgi:hypothetical protein